MLIDVIQAFAGANDLTRTEKKGAFMKDYTIHEMETLSGYKVDAFNLITLQRHHINIQSLNLKGIFL